VVFGSDTVVGFGCTEPGAASFAEYMGHRVAAEVTGHTTAWTGFTLNRKSWGSGPPGSFT
jgi:hypothetical protein